MRSCSVPLKKFGNDLWADLGALGSRVWEVTCEKSDLKDNQYSFIGGHRVRLFKLKDNVHFKLPADFKVDIRAVPATGR